MKKLIFLFLLITGLANETQAKPFLVTGRMNYMANLEGGCWVLDAEGGTRYELTGTQEQMEKVQVNGRQLKLEVEEANNIASICMAGKMVRILRIVDQVGYPVDLAYVTVKVTGRVYKTKAGCWYLKTSKGQKYDLELASIPKAKRKSGARVKNQYFRIFMEKSASDCGFDGKATFIANSSIENPIPSKAMPKKPADPR